MMKALGCDDTSTKNIDRILRLPGTRNLPNAKKKKVGRVACQTKLIAFGDASYGLDAFPELKVSAEGSDSKSSNGSAGEQQGDKEPGSNSGRSELPPHLASLLHVDGHGAFKSRSELLFAFLTGVLRNCISVETIVAACLDDAYQGRGIYEHCHEKGGRKYIERQIGNAKKRNTSSAPASPEYGIQEGGYYWLKPTRNGSVRVKLSNFTAFIKEDVKLDDGSGNTERMFAIEGSLGRADVPAEKFDSMQWVTREWGAKASISPGPHFKFMAAAITALSSDLSARTVFTHLGWRKIRNEWVYLHGGGAIGSVEGVQVSLTGDKLAKFVLPPVSDLHAAIRASLELLCVAPHQIVYPLWSAIYRAPLGEFAPVTVTPWLVGPSGAYKTTLALLGQAHWTSAIDAGSAANWTSTANANERLAFLAKDALLVIDDFAPRGTSFEIAKKHADADRLIRGQANRAGRLRMNADATLKAEMHPRCGLLCTGEDVPSGHSLRARMLTIECRPGDVDLKALTRVQENAVAGRLAEAMTGYVTWIAKQNKAEFVNRERQLRAEFTGLHTRTPENAASLMLGVECGLRFASDVGAINADQVKTYTAEARAALAKLIEAQTAYLASERPADRFLALIQSVVSSGRGHLQSASGAEPCDSESFGWREVARRENGEPIMRGQGRCIGWIDGNDVYLDADTAYAEAQELARTQSASIPITQDTLWRRLDDAGAIKSKEEERLKIRKTLAGIRRRVIHLDFGKLFEVEPCPI